MPIRAKDIAQLYQTRDALTAKECVALFCHPDVLGHRDARKFCTYLILHRLGAAASWRLLCSAIVNRSLTTQRECELIGRAINDAYLHAIELPLLKEASKTAIANFVYKPLIRFTIFTKRVYADKFGTILTAAVENRYGGVAEMLFVVSRETVWQYLTAPNSSVRRGAHFVCATCFPPKCADTIEESTYFTRHLDALIASLKDEDIDICIQGTAATANIVSIWCNLISSSTLSIITATLLDLMKEEDDAIRVSIVKSCRYFADCHYAARRNAIFLKRICSMAINDISKDVRLSACKLLDLYRECQTFKSPVVPLRKLLSRLDYEELEDVELELSKIVYSISFYETMTPTSRYNWIKQLCSMNKAAALDVHRRLIEFTTLDQSVHHLDTAASVSLYLLKEIYARQKEIKTRQEAAAIYNDAGMEVEADDDQDINWQSSEDGYETVKNVLDCCLVAYSCLHEQLIESSHPKFASLCQSFMDIVHWTLDHDEAVAAGLVSTALIIASLINIKGMLPSQIMHSTERLLRAGTLNTQYLESFAMHDMQRLLEIFDEGLTQLRSSSVQTAISTKCADSISSAAKYRRLTTAFIDELVVVDALMFVLSSSICSPIIHSNFTTFIHQFAFKLEVTRDNLASMSKDEASKKFLRVYELWTVVAILDYTLAKSDYDFWTRSDPMLVECEWLERHLAESSTLLNDDAFMEIFLYCINLHLRGYQHSATALDAVVRLLDLFKYSKTKDEALKTRLDECKQHLKHAVKFITDEGKVASSKTTMPERRSKRINGKKVKSFVVERQSARRRSKRAL